MWAEQESDGVHYRSMSNEKFKKVAVGVYVFVDKDNKSRDKYWINMFFRN